MEKRDKKTACVLAAFMQDVYARRSEVLFIISVFVCSCQNTYSRANYTMLRISSISAKVKDVKSLSGYIIYGKNIVDADRILCYLYRQEQRKSIYFPYPEAFRLLNLIFWKLSHAVF